MVMEEQIAQSALSAVEQGATLILRISGKAANILAGATSTTVSKIGKTTKDTLRQGRESVVKLTKKSGGDMHFTEQLSREDMRNARSQLHRYGVHYGIEKNGSTGKYYLIFKGSDADVIKHALERTLATVEGKASITPVAVPDQARGVDPAAESVAVTKASDLVPETLQPDAPRFSMRFKTVQWDRDAKIIGDNLTKLGIPYTMKDGDGAVKHVEFPESCRPAVKRFIDTYARTVKHFDSNRVLNYDQLAAAPSRQSPSKTVPKKKTASDVRRQLKQDTRERINRSRGEAPKPSVSKSRTR